MTVVVSLLVLLEDSVKSMALGWLKLVCKTLKRMVRLSVMYRLLNDLCVLC